MLFFFCFIIKVMKLLLWLNQINESGAVMEYYTRLTRAFEEKYKKII